MLEGGKISHRIWVYEVSPQTPPVDLNHFGPVVDFLL